MLLTDTDNLTYNIKRENVDEDFYKDNVLFDFNDYLKDSKYYSNAGNLVVGIMKEETCGVPIKGFVGLKSNMYTFKTT